MKFASKKMTLVDGGMHHLGAKKEDVCADMILVCSEEEVREMAELINDGEFTASHREYLTYKGLINGKPIGIVSIGHGCMPMAIAVEELKHLDVTGMVKLGECQAIISGIKPGTIIVPSAAVRSEGASREYVSDAYPACASIPLLGKLADALEKEFAEVMVGIVRSHDAYYTEQPGDPEGMSRIEKWAKLGVLANEHELSAMFVLAEILKMEAAGVLIVRENIADQTALSEKEFNDIRRKLNRIIIETITKS